MVASGPGTSVVNYSNRFSLSNMTGSFPSRVKNGIHSIQDAHGPTPREGHEHERLQKRQTAGEYTVFYAYQTGPTRYAPMAKKPGNTIPPGKPTPQNPTSPYTIATTYMPAPTVETTVSADLTYSVSSIENTVCQVSL